MGGTIIAIANQKGGCGKTTTAINLAQALSIQKIRVLLVDLDPQGNATQGLGVSLDAISLSVADLITDRDLSPERVIYKGDQIDLIPATPLLSRTERQMVGMTNGELRLGQRLSHLKPNYDLILLDTPPTFGPLMNSSLNAASHLIVPVDSGYFAMLGIKELLSEIEEIRRGTNPDLRILGFVLTLSDQTNIASETWDGLVAGFGEQVFETKIRKSVKLKEAPVFGRTIFHHAPSSSGAIDYANLAYEVIQRLDLSGNPLDSVNAIPLSSEESPISLGGAK